MGKMHRFRCLFSVCSPFFFVKLGTDIEESFIGTSVLIYGQLPSADPANSTAANTTRVSISIDRGSATTVSFPNPTTGPFGNIPLFSSEKNPLPYGNHNLSVQVPAGSTFVLDYILVNPARTLNANITTNTTTTNTNTTNTTTISTVKSPSKPVSTGTVAGAVVGALAFLAVDLLVIFLFMRRRQMKAEANITDHPNGALFSLLFVIHLLIVTVN
jgi:hypothetical protein